MSAREAMDEAAGNLSAEERASACVAAMDPRRSTESAQAHYEHMLCVAKKAARELNEMLVNEGVPARPPADGNGGFPAMPGAIRMKALRLINSFAWANTRLWLAAQMICDMRQLEDDGAAEGVVWEVIL